MVICRPTNSFEKDVCYAAAPVCQEELSKSVHAAQEIRVGPSEST
jgi:hypothetical protein